LIYIGDHRTVTKPDEINGIIEKFQENKKAIYVNKIKILISFDFPLFRSIVEWKLMKFMMI
jgi:hypothetical protein